MFDYRRMLMTPSQGQRNFERHLFDWQITPFTALIDYLERDFEGVFERADLSVIKGEVTHRRHLARYPHDFHPQSGAFDDAVIDRQYDAARRKFEHLAAKFRTHLSRPGPFLYVVRGGPDRAAVARLTQLLARHPQHRFDLLCVPYEDDGHGPGHLAGLAHRAFIPLSLDKSPGREWEGDDGAWDLVLSPWALTLHGENRIDRRYRGEPDQA